jgi:hypothetical protein
VEVAVMFARVASFEGGDTKRIQEMNEERRSSGSMGLPEGVQRVLFLSDEQGGKRLFITFFESREALDASQARFESMGDEIPEDVRGKRTAVDVYEVVADETP